MANTASHSKLNMEQVLAAAKKYAVSTGVECLVLTENGETILNPCEGQFHTDLCYCLSKDIGKCCLNTHREGAINAAGGEKQRAYYCPMGLLHWASPIIIDGRIEAAFIAGHTFLNQSPAELASLKNVTAAHEELLKAYPGLKKSLMESPVISNERLNSMKGLLDLVAAAFSDRTLSDNAYHDMREAFQKNIGGFPQESPEIPWQKLQQNFDGKSASQIDAELAEITEAIAQRATPEQGKAALVQLVLSVYDHSLEQEGQCFLADRCLNAMNELERIETTEELAQWAKNNIIGLLEAKTILPRLKNADMIYSALQYIEDHYNEKFSLQDIADYVHFSAPYFSKVFKREMDTTFTKYLTNVRIEKSKMLLKNTDHALSDIPAMVGFEEQSYFTRVFRTATGTSPGKYRENRVMKH